MDGSIDPEGIADPLSHRPHLKDHTNSLRSLRDRSLFPANQWYRSFLRFRSRAFSTMSRCHLIFPQAPENLTHFQQFRDFKDTRSLSDSARTAANSEDLATNSPISCHLCHHVLLKIVKFLAQTSKFSLMRDEAYSSSDTGTQPVGPVGLGYGIRHLRRQNGRTSGAFGPPDASHLRDSKLD